MRQVIHKQVVLLAVGALGLSACEGQTVTGPPLQPVSADAKCDPAPGQAFVGKTLTAELGQQIFTATGANLLRWGPPRMALTMDYRPGRVTISYDDRMTITKVACG